MQASRILSLPLAIFLLTVVSTPASQFKLLKTFAANGVEGKSPSGNGTIIGGKIYGFTTSGGAGGVGTLYRVNLDGTQFEKLRDFAASEGSPTSLVGASDKILISLVRDRPGDEDDDDRDCTLYNYGIGNSTLSPIASINKIYGPVKLCFVEGDYAYGVADGSVRRWSLAGGEHQLLYSFDFDNFSGQQSGSDARDLINGGGNVIYGLNIAGGNSDAGTIFKVNKDGTGYQDLHSFGGLGYMVRHDFDVTGPAIVLLGGRIYGIVKDGGPSAPNAPNTEAGGFLYSVDTDGTAFTILKTFYYNMRDVSYLFPYCLATDGALLYIGMDSSQGSPVTDGALLAIKPDGTGLRELAQFQKSNGANGRYPRGLIFSGSRLYGSNSAGGASGAGTVWSYEPKGSTTPAPYTGPLYGKVTFGGSLYSVRTSPVTSKTSRGITTTVDGTQMFATKLSNAFVLDRVRQAGLISSVSGYSIVCTDDDRKLAFYAYKPGSPLVALEETIGLVEAGVLQAPTTKSVYNAALNKTTTSESGSERIYATGRFLGMDVSVRRTLTYKSAQAVVNGINSTFYPGTSTAVFFGTDEAGKEFVEGTFLIAAPQAIQVP